RTMLKPVTFYSEGVKLAGDLFLPADIKPGERRAGIVLCHGYTGVRSIYLPDNARILAEAGYVVLTFDYKGWGDSDGATQGPLEVIDDPLGFNPEWVVERIAPRPILFITTDDDRLVPPQESEAMYARAGEPKKLVVLKGFGHYEVYGGDAFRQVMEE